MNNIIKQPITKLGHDFIDPEFIPEGKDEYHLRNEQQTRKKPYRNLTAGEIDELKANGNYADDWQYLLVSDVFHTTLIRNCRFYGLVRIGNLEACSIEFNSLRLPVGLYSSTIISCDLGDNVVIDNVSFLSYYIVGSEVMIVNVNEMACTDHAKFGNGVVMEGEKENVRVWIELCNENAGRKVLAFDGMQVADAWLWTRYRADEQLMDRFKEFTENSFDRRRGNYGTVGDRTVIKNTRIIKDVKIGSDAYIKGANKLKNLTINSSEDAHSQVGEGCELVNGIIGFGCRIFYGVKAVRFMMASFSQLKYGARLINSFLGDNSTISCCEVLNSLIFPAHEQHHNNSFLCAALLMGQSNMAAGATVGSNHNSRSADGELIAGRGFWPGLCVSLKHNSKFASFNILAKGDFPSEINNPFPFSLIANDVSKDRLVIMPGYWFLYNMYALARNAGKYGDRDRRKYKRQYLEYEFLAPDTIEEIIHGIRLIAAAVATAKMDHTVATDHESLIANGIQLLESDVDFTSDEILIKGIENSQRKVQLIRVPQAYSVFKELIILYGVTQLMRLMEKNEFDSFGEMKAALQREAELEWINMGGQLIPKRKLETILKKIREGGVHSWKDVHVLYYEASLEYEDDKMIHGFFQMFQLLQWKADDLTPESLCTLVDKAIITREWMTDGIYTSRAKDYTNPFRKMVYGSEDEMDKVLGKLSDNHFIQSEQEKMQQFKMQGLSMIQKLKLY